MEKVLVVNDSRLERLVLKDLISSMGYAVESSDDINSIATIEGYRPDIIIANQTMNYIQGIDLIRLVKDKYTGIRCYLSSCSVLPESTLANDIEGYFQTPISPRDLEQILREEVQSTANSADKNSTFLNQHRVSSKEEILTKNSLSFCPFCGERLPDHSRTFTFCSFCGARLP